MSGDYRQRVLRDKLNEDKIKLWLEPYTTADGAQGLVPIELSQKYSQELNLQQDEVLQTLETLRIHALHKLASRSTFKNTGLATVKIKIAGKPVSTTGASKATITLQLPLANTGRDLRGEVSRVTNIPANRLKLICMGNIIDDGLSLELQNIKNESQIMALHLSQSELESQAEQKRQETFAKTREAAEILSKKVEDADDPSRNYYLQITDQSGKPLNLPHEEHTALTLAMTLHEKGRAALKRKDYSDSLLLLLEADKEFSKCRADILNAVDNYAILCLDIVWCYFYLQNVDCLPNADERLRTCEECFARSYGDDLQRLATVKGSTSTEMILFLKLHVIQAVIAFHQHLHDLATSKLIQAEREMRLTHVDDEALSQVVCLGFSQREARLGLRSCGSDVSRAVPYIINKREERKARKTKEREEKRQKKLSRKIGKTGNGEWADGVIYENLVSMGVARGAAAEATRRSNNNLDLALELLQTQPDIHTARPPNFSEDDITNEMIEQITAMGFDREMALNVLKHTSGAVESALDQLLTGSFVPPTSSNESNNSAASGPSAEEMRDNKAIEMIIDDIPSDEEAHLDDDITEIQAIVHEYRAMLDSMVKK